MPLDGGDPTKYLQLIMQFYSTPMNQTVTLAQVLAQAMIYQVHGMRSSSFENRLIEALKNPSEKGRAEFAAVPAEDRDLMIARLSDAGYRQDTGFSSPGNYTVTDVEGEVLGVKVQKDDLEKLKTFLAENNICCEFHESSRDAETGMISVSAKNRTDEIRIPAEEEDRVRDIFKQKGLNFKTSRNRDGTLTLSMWDGHGHGQGQKTVEAIEEANRKFPDKPIRADIIASRFDAGDLAAALRRENEKRSGGSAIHFEADTGATFSYFCFMEEDAKGIKEVLQGHTIELQESREGMPTGHTPLIPGLNDIVTFTGVYRENIREISEMKTETETMMLLKRAKQYGIPISVQGPEVKDGENMFRVYYPAAEHRKMERAEREVIKDFSGFSGGLLTRQLKWEAENSVNITNSMLNLEWDEKPLQTGDAFQSENGYIVRVMGDRVSGEPKRLQLTYPGLDKSGENIVPLTEMVRIDLLKKKDPKAIARIKMFASDMERPVFMHNDEYREFQHSSNQAEMIHQIQAEQSKRLANPKPEIGEKEAMEVSLDLKHRSLVEQKLNQERPAADNMPQAIDENDVPMAEYIRNIHGNEETELDKASAQIADAPLFNTAQAYSQGNSFSQMNQKYGAFTAEEIFDRAEGVLDEASERSYDFDSEPAVGLNSASTLFEGEEYQDISLGDSFATSFDDINSTIMDEFEQAYSPLEEDGPGPGGEV